MSDVLVEWAKDHLNALYQKGIDSEEDRLSYTLSSIFDPGVHILYNHGPIGLEKFKEHLQAASTAVTKATVEWKEVVSLPKQGDTETEQDDVVAGYFIVTRSMKFRIRVTPAQMIQHCFFSAKLRGKSENKEGGGSAPLISEFFITSVTKQAPIRLQGVPVLETS